MCLGDINSFGAFICLYPEEAKSLAGNDIDVVPIGMLCGTCPLEMLIEKLGTLDLSRK